MKLFLKIAQYSRENTCVNLLLLILEGVNMKPEMKFIRQEI